MSRYITAIVLALTIGIMILVGIAITDSISHSSTAIEVDENRESEAALLSGTSFVELGNGEGTNETVYDSRGWAINLTGADDSYFQSDGAVDYGSGNFTTSVWASITNGSKGETMAAVSLNGRAVIAYNGTGTNEWVGWYYNESTRNSYTVTLAATGDLNNLHNLILRANSTHLSLYRNDTDAAHTAFVATNVEDAPNTTQNWDGRIEELRTFDSALNASVRSTLHNDGVAAQPGTARTSRAMFDQPNKDTQLLFFTSSSLTTSNASYSAGLPGNELTPGSVLLSQSDYEWREDGPEIRAISGGRLEFAPVAYVDYDKKTSEGVTISTLSNVYEMAPLIILALILAALLAGTKSFS